MITTIIVISSFGLAAFCFVIFVNMVDGMPFRKLVYLVARTLFTMSLAVIGISAILFAIRTLLGE